VNSATLNSEQADLKIFDLAGKILYQKTFSHKTKLKSEKNSSGFYLIEVKGNNSDILFKALKN